MLVVLFSYFEWPGVSDFVTHAVSPGLGAGGGGVGHKPVRRCHCELCQSRHGGAHGGFGGGGESGGKCGRGIGENSTKVSGVWGKVKHACVFHLCVTCVLLVCYVCVTWVMFAFLLGLFTWSFYLVFLLSLSTRSFYLVFLLVEIYLLSLLGISTWYFYLVVLLVFSTWYFTRISNLASSLAFPLAFVSPFLTPFLIPISKPISNPSMHCFRHSVQALGGVLLVTADHGNCEKVRTQWQVTDHNGLY